MSGNYLDIMKPRFIEPSIIHRRYENFYLVASSADLIRMGNF